jgi:hypothetical protein
MDHQPRAVPVLGAGSRAREMHSGQVGPEGRQPQLQQLTVMATHRAALVLTLSRSKSLQVNDLRSCGGTQRNGIPAAREMDEPAGTH